MFYLKLYIFRSSAGTYPEHNLVKYQATTTIIVKESFQVASTLI